MSHLNGKAMLDAMIELRQARGMIGDLEAQVLRERYGLQGVEDLGHRPGMLRHEKARNAVNALQDLVVGQVRGDLPTAERQARMQYGRGARLGGDAVCAALIERMMGSSTIQ